MFSALGRLASRRPWLVIVTWIVFAVAVVGLAPAFKATQDQAEFLPDHYESIKAFNLQDEAFPSNSQVGAIVVFDREDGGKLTADDQAEVQSVVDGVSGKMSGGDLKKAFTGIQAQPPSENGLVQLMDSVTGDLDYRVTGPSPRATTSRSPATRRCSSSRWRPSC